MGRVAVTAALADERWEIVAAADRDGGARDWFGARAPQAEVFCDAMDMAASLRPGALLAVVTPPPTHASLALLALERRLHVLCEKPMACDATSARRMLEAARAAGAAGQHPTRLAVVDHQLRYNAARRWIGERVRHGELGRVRHVSSVMTIPSLRSLPWSWWSDRDAGGGVLNEFASHTVDLLQWWFGPCDHAVGQLRTVTASRRTADGASRDNTSDDLASMQLLWEDGLVADIAVSSVGRPPRRVLELHGDRASICLDVDDTVRLVDDQGSSTHDFREEAPSLIGDPNETYTQPFARLLADLADWMTGNRRALPAATFEDGLRVVETLDAVRRSAASPLPPIGRMPA
jgi:predicted dehydrogenase